MRSRAPVFLVAAGLLLALLGATRAHAANDLGDPALAQAKAVFGEAEKQYALGRFEEALKHFERAFELKPLPEFLFNIGQCHRNLGHWERANFFFQGYLNRVPKARNR